MSYGFNPDHITISTILFSLIYAIMLVLTFCVLRVFSKNVEKKLMFNIFPSLALLIGLPIFNNAMNMWISNGVLVVSEKFTYYSLGFSCLIILPVCIYCLIKLNIAIGRNIQ